MSRGAFDFHGCSFRETFRVFLGAIALCFVIGHTSWSSQPAAEAGAGDDVLVYIGTYARGQGQGIHLSRLDLETGRLSAPVLAAEVENPSFVAIHPNGAHLYSVAEVGSTAGVKSGGVCAFSIDPQTGLLKRLNQRLSGGPGPCFVAVDRIGRNVLVANYGGGSVSCLPIEEDGQLQEASCFIQHAGSSVHPTRQTAPHAHSINVAPDNRFAFAADLGLDKILVYRFDAAAGKLTPNEPPFAALAPGAGPRHFAFHPDGRRAYVINEIDSTITAFVYDAEHGRLTAQQTISTLPENFEGNNTTAEVQVHPSGRFVYGSNRGHNSIAVFAVDRESGRLTPVEHEPTQGESPRNFGIDPTGQYLLAANQNSGNVVVFRIDQETGALSPTGSSIEVPRPVCVRFLSNSN